MPNNNNNDNNTHLRNKIDFMLFISVTNANCNGDPLNGNRPRTNYDGYGEISDVCIKRKIRNRMQDLGKEIFVQSEDRANDNFTNLKARFDGFKASLKNDISEDDLAKEVCKKWLDVRTFGQVFAYKAAKKTKSASKTDKDKGNSGVSIGIRGPVSIHIANSIEPVEISSMQITKSVNGEDPKQKKESENPEAGENSNSTMSSDRMGMKHFVRYGLYQIKGSINVQLAEKTGFTDADAETLKQCLKTLFINDESSARPAGSMEVEKIYWWKHNCKTGQYSTAEVHRSVTVERKDKEKIPTSFDDYNITGGILSNSKPENILKPEIIESSDCNK